MFTGHLTIDEMLVEFHDRVGFRQYSPSKPGKFGLKLYWVAEAQAALPLRVILHTRRQTVSDAEKNEHGGFAPTQVMQPFLSGGRNLTTDNWSTSQKLAVNLAAKRTMLVGTLKNNSKCLPQIAKSTEGRQLGDSVHFYSYINTLLLG